MLKFTRIFKFSTMPLYHCTDLANASHSMTSISPHYTDFYSKMSTLFPSNLYHEMDGLSRDILVYLSNDLSLGMGMSIALISIGLKMAFVPLQTLAQLNGLKMKLLDPETKSIMAKSQQSQKKGDI